MINMQESSGMREDSWLHVDCKSWSCLHLKEGFRAVGWGPAWRSGPAYEKIQRGQEKRKEEISTTFHFYVVSPSSWFRARLPKGLKLLLDKSAKPECLQL